LWIRRRASLVPHNDIDRPVDGSSLQRCQVHFLGNVLARSQRFRGDGRRPRSAPSSPDRKADMVTDQLDTIAGMIGWQLSKVEELSRTSIPRGIT
jgi:putative transposase